MAGMLRKIRNLGNVTLLCKDSVSCINKKWGIIDFQIWIWTVFSEKTPPPSLKIWVIIACKKVKKWCLFCKNKYCMPTDINWKCSSLMLFGPLARFDMICLNFNHLPCNLEYDFDYMITTPNSFGILKIYTVIEIRSNLHCLWGQAQLPHEPECIPSQQCITLRIW